MNIDADFHAALLEYYRASRQLHNTIGAEDATLEDERKAEKRFEDASAAMLIYNAYP